MVKKVIGVFLFVAAIAAESVYAQQDAKPQAKATNEAAVARMAAGCGPNDIQFEVKSDKKRHPQGQPEAGKAIVYVFSEGFYGSAMRTGLDGKWMGATYNDSYFFFTVGPGEHRLCMDKQSSGEKLSDQGAAIAFTAEPGKTYYFTAGLFVDAVRAKIKFEPLDSAEGLFMVSSFAFSSWQVKAAGE